MKRTRPLTQKEIDALLALVDIAGAGIPDEGDYQGYDYKAMGRAREKLINMTPAPASRMEDALREPLRLARRILATPYGENSFISETDARDLAEAVIALAEDAPAPAPAPDISRAREVIVNLLATPDLNFDELEETTRQAIDDARAFLAESAEKYRLETNGLMEKVVSALKSLAKDERPTP